MEIPADAFYLDEEPLRKTILRAYFGKSAVPLDPEPLIAHLRDLLSGPEGADSEPATYLFEVRPEAIVPAFLRALEGERQGLAAAVAEPLLDAGDRRVKEKKLDEWANAAMLVGSMAGSVAVKHNIDEPTAAALLAGFLLAIARLGPKQARALYRAAVSKT